MAESVEKYLRYNSRLQLISWVFALVPLIIFATVLYEGTARLKQLREELRQVEIKRSSAEYALRDVETKREEAKKKLNLVVRQINDFNNSSSPARPQTRYSVDGKPVVTHIYIAPNQDLKEADLVKRLLESKGYDVKDPFVGTMQNSPHETTVRFFQYDKASLYVARELVSLIKAQGFNIRTEYDAEFTDGTKGPIPVGNFEVWIGKDQSYRPIRAGN